MSYAIADENLYLYKAVQNLVYGLKLLADTTDKSLARVVQPYLYPLPTAYPCISIYPGSRLELSDEGTGSWDGQSYQLIIRYYIGKATEGLDGKLQLDLFKFLPTIINYINAHPDLVYTDSQDVDAGEQVGHIPELTADGVQARVISRLGIFRDDVTHIGVEIGINLDFQVEIEEITFVDN